MTDHVVGTTMTEPVNKTIGPFLLFRGDDFYPAGGWCDYAGSYPTLADAVAQPKRNDISGSWRHVVDASTGRIVFEEPESFYEPFQRQDGQEYQHE